MNKSFLGGQELQVILNNEQEEVNSLFYNHILISVPYPRKAAT